MHETIRHILDKITNFSLVGKEFDGTKVLFEQFTAKPYQLPVKKEEKYIEPNTAARKDKEYLEGKRPNPS